jgi:opacity protein-like surface antigen
MNRKIVVGLAAALLFFALGAALSAQDVLMNSAETINKGNVKLALFPAVLFGKNGGDSIFGVAGRIGYGLTESLDVEAKAGIFRGLRYFGADIEYWFLKGGNFNASAAVGGHLTDARDEADSSGLDVALIASTRPAERLELYGGLKAAFDSIKNENRSVTRIHIVPGLEYRISNDLDFLAEVGIGLNDFARSYASVGLSFYLFR